MPNIVEHLRARGADAVQRVVSSWLGGKNHTETPTLLEDPKTLGYKNVGSFRVQMIKVGNNTLQAIDLNDGTACIKKAESDKTRVPLVPNEKITLPFGPVDRNHKFIPPTRIRFMYYTSDGSEKYGAKVLVDRFPGESPHLNRTYGGGLFIQDNQIVLGTHDELVEAVLKGKPAAQLMYEWDSTNAEELMDQFWNHRNSVQRERVGSSLTESWCWYAQSAERTVFGATIVKRYRPEYALQRINEVNNLLFGPNPWKAGLTAFSLSGGFIITEPGSDKPCSNYLNPNVLHGIPACLVVTPNYH